jgi:hypothetical protein
MLDGDPGPVLVERICLAPGCERPRRRARVGREWRKTCGRAECVRAISYTAERARKIARSKMGQRQTPESIERIRAAKLQDVVSYSRAHIRHRRLIDTSACALCGSTTNVDVALKSLGVPPERIKRDVAGWNEGLAYTLDASDYIPACRRCNLRMAKL